MIMMHGWNSGAHTQAPTPALLSKLRKAVYDAGIFVVTPDAADADANDGMNAVEQEEEGVLAEPLTAFTRCVRSGALAGAPRECDDLSMLMGMGSWTLGSWQTNQTRQRHVGYVGQPVLAYPWTWQ